MHSFVSFGSMLVDRMSALLFVRCMVLSCCTVYGALMIHPAL